ncbi:S8 family peptidase [Aneurinibacillus tyrosinisolvens]|uniref:S8 family peptidase n=1 Tax=Aneurinibacillus tyrosinisolvens TaxID=1443435 RepID=UPI0006995F5A|nr:S8 family serine peptidase [Aneurinibacillus tyrosinisolvens]
MNKGKSHQKWATSLVSLLLVMNAGLPLAYAEEVAQSSDGQKEVIVVYKNNEGKQAVLNNSEEVDHQFKTVPAVSATLEEKNIQQLEQNPNIAYIEDNITFRLAEGGMQVLDDIRAAQTTGDSIAVSPEESQWDLQAVQAPAAWNEGLTGKGIKVAVIDSGISAHPDLAIAGGVSTVGYTASYEDDNGHGTHVAGTIGARHDGSGMVGVAPDASLYAVKAMDNNGDGTLQDILEAIDWSIVNNMDIINLSLGSDTDSDIFHSIIDKANERGIIIVGASGNSGTPDGSGNTVEYPAKYSSVVAVSAVDSSKSRASFSSTGEEVEFAAPGVDIVSTFPGGRYAVGSGTSMAAPHVAGLFALLKQKYPGETNGQLREEMINYAEDLGDAGKDPWFGYGFTRYVQQPVEQEASQPKQTNEIQPLPTDPATVPSEPPPTDPVQSIQPSIPETKPAPDPAANPTPAPVAVPAPASGGSGETPASAPAAQPPASPISGGGGGAPVSAPAPQPASPAFGGGGGGGGGAAPSLDKNTIKGSAGGTISNNDATITIPADAAASDIKVTVNVIMDTTSFPAAENSKLIGDIYEIKKDKPGNFAKPVTVALPFEKSKVDTDKYKVSLFWLNEETNKWVELDNVKIEGDKVSGTVTHFTKFAVIATKKIAEAPKQPETLDVPKAVFSDITGHWAETSFTRLIDMGVLHGFDDGTLKPNRNITRAEFAAMVVNVFNLQPKGEKTFKDVAPSYWARNEISIAASNGIINGYSPAAFGPNDLLTREQMAAIVVKAAKLPLVNGGNTFKDQASISRWAAQSVKTASANGIVHGLEGNLFNPKGKATRAEAVAVIVNALDK